MSIVDYLYLRIQTLEKANKELKQQLINNQYGNKIK